MGVPGVQRLQTCLRPATRSRMPRSGSGPSPRVPIRPAAGSRCYPAAKIAQGHESRPSFTTSRSRPRSKRATRSASSWSPRRTSRRSRRRFLLRRTSVVIDAPAAWRPWRAIWFGAIGTDGAIGPRAALLLSKAARAPASRPSRRCLRRVRKRRHRRARDARARRIAGRRGDPAASCSKATASAGTPLAKRCCWSPPGATMYRR